MIEPGVVRPCSHFDQFVAIQINESELLATELGFESALSEYRPGPSATITLRAPRFRNASAAAPTSIGFVFTSTPAIYST